MSAALFALGAFLLCLAHAPLHTSAGYYYTSPPACPAYPTVLPCPTLASRDILFLVDQGGTADVNTQRHQVADFLSAAFCRYDNFTSRVGIIVYGTSAFTLLNGLQYYNYTNWAHTVSTYLLSAMAVGSGQAPLVEALELAHATFARAGSLTNPIVYVVTSSLPQPVPVGTFTNSQNLPFSWSGFPFPSVWYPSYSCVDTVHSSCSGPYTYDYYLQRVHQAAKALTDQGVQLSITAIASTVTGSCPATTFYNGRPDVSACDDDVTNPAWPGAFDWCAKYPSSLSTWTDTSNFVCRCTYIQGPLTNTPVNCVSTSLSSLLAATDAAACGAPTSSPTLPTLKPTARPTTPTTLAPKAPTSSPFCGQLSLPSCGDLVPRDLIFVLDKSSSMNQTKVRGELLDYVEQLYCSFDDTAGSFVGLISFGFDVKVEIRLGRQTQNQWKAAVDALRDSPTLDITNGLTPTAEALELAHREMNTYGDPAHLQLILVVSDGTPNPIPQLDTDADFPSVTSSSASSVYPDTYYPTDTCDPLCDTYSYNSYLGTILPGIATAIKDDNIRILFLAVHDQLGDAPQTEYFMGLPQLNHTVHNDGLTDYVCNFDETVDPQDFCAPNCDWCEEFPDYVDGEINKCRCTTLAGPICSLPLSTTVFTGPADWNVTNMIEITYGAACYTASPTKFPTLSPTHRATIKPTRSPRPMPTHSPSRRPSRAPSSSYPSRSPTGTPSAAPTTPTTFMPSQTPTTSRPSASPTMSPSNSPTTSRPSRSPTRSPSGSPSSNPSDLPSRAPSRTPTHSPTRRPTRHPSASPSRSAPTKSPTLPTPRPTRRPSGSPTIRPSRAPTNRPTFGPSAAPVLSRPSASPTRLPSRSPSVKPTASPTAAPTPPTARPTMSPSNAPSTSTVSLSGVLPLLTIATNRHAPSCSRALLPARPRPRSRPRGCARTSTLGTASTRPRTPT
jgi:hypothetical protein